MSGRVVAYAALLCILCGELFAAAAPAFAPGSQRSLKAGVSWNQCAGIRPAACQKTAWPPQRPSKQRPTARLRDLAQRGGRFGDAFMVDTGIVYVPSSNSQYLCGVASNGNGWRVMWLDDYSYGAYTSGIGPDGSVLDGAGKMVAGQGGYGTYGSHSIAATGSGFIAVWPQDYYGIWASRLDSTGGLIDSFLVYQDSSEQAEPAIAFDGDSTCLVVWTESPYQNSDVYGIRVTTGGRVLDQQPIPVANQSEQDEMMPVVAFGQGVYLVAWTSLCQGWFTWATAKAVRVSEDGAVIDTAVFLRHNATSIEAYPAVAFGDTCFLASWSEGIEQPDVYAKRVSASGAFVDTTAVRLSSGPNYDISSSIAFDGTRYLVMWEQDSTTGGYTVCGRRITSDGMPLDSGLIRLEFDDYNGESPCVSADQANFLVAVSIYDTLSYRQGVCCVRISPAGAVLDTGIFFPLTADAQYGPSGATDGTQFLASWLESRATGSVVTAARISADGRVLDPVGFTVCDAPSYKYSLSTAYGDSIYLMAWQDQSGYGGIRCARVTRDGQALDPDGIVVCVGGSYPGVPDVSFGGENFLVVWYDGRSGPQNIYAARVSPAGVVLDPNGFAVAAADTFYDGAPVVCFPGPNYLVVWEGSSTSTWDPNIYGALVSPAGHIAKRRFLVSDAAGDGYSTAVASGPTSSLVVWPDVNSYPTAMLAARVRADGAVLDPGGLRVGSTLYSNVLPRVTADEAGFKVLWRSYDYSTDTTYFAVAEVDTAGAVTRTEEWFGMPGSDNGFDAVYGAGPELLLLFSCWTDSAQGRYYGTDRLWGRLGEVPGIEQADTRQLGSATRGASIVRGVLFLPSSLLSPPYSLFSLDGREVLDLHPGANDVRALAPGVYFVRQAPAHVTSKVVIAR